MNSELNAISIPMNWRLELDWIELELDLDWIGNPMNTIIVHKNVTNEYIFFMIINANAFYHNMICQGC